MYLTKNQERLLAGEKGNAIAKMMKLIVKIGEVNNADKLIQIRSAQIAGVSYHTVGDAIFSFFELLSSDKVMVKVPSWLNPAGMDRLRWKEMGIKTAFAEKQFEILKHYEEMGIDTTLTCTPYLIGLIPSFGDHLAWSESSAVSMANSFFGARTNREGGPSSLASAITGFTANYGMHKEENRIPETFVKIKAETNTLSDFSALGYWYGEMLGDSIPFFSSLRSFSIDEAKMLSSAIAASGSVPLFHVETKTPEAKKVKITEIENKIIYTEEDKEKVYEHFNQIKDYADLVAIGCPHTSLVDLQLISEYTQNAKVKENIEVWIFTSKLISQDEKASRLIHELEEKGIKIFTDTCMVVSPAVSDKFKNILTNSAKAAFYLTRDGTINVNLLSLSEIMGSVVQ
ncbi:MAG: aconitase X catalytic domain-containing protein [Candidatus Heimdallarchaeota archaeon]|nr:aconitase X catalytic domain-containing protein [Candidatus Heimdallarchaeota archaeon]MCK4877812.1 aconitase X catalytic domain-containing protein [Candidatus Heimdallarchaeota archaeon]